MIQEFNKTNNDPVVKLEVQDDLDEPSCGVEDIIKPNMKKIINKLICYKCKSNTSSYFNRSEYVCKECFLKNLNHKFRSNLRVQCKIKHEDYVLVCISGGVNSMAMLYWFYATFNDTSSNRKLFFKLKVLYVDDSILQFPESYDLVIEERKRRKELLRELCAKYNFDIDIVTIEQSLNLHDDNLTDLTYPELMGKYLELHSFIPQVGSFDTDFNAIMIRNLIFRYALNKNFTKIVLANNGQNLVTDVFSKIVRGRGFGLKEQITHIDSHYLNGRIVILRPLKDFLMKEILLFDHIHKLEIIYPVIKKSQPKTSSIAFQGNTDKLLSFFFDNLQSKMSNSITNVLGTAEKLKMIPRDQTKTEICSFCLNDADEVYNQLEIGSIDSFGQE